VVQRRTFSFLHQPLLIEYFLYPSGKQHFIWYPHACSRRNFLLLLLLVSLGRTRKFLFLLGKTFPVTISMWRARAFSSFAKKDGRKKKGGKI
jgi:hypothetical protein